MLDQARTRSDIEWTLRYLSSVDWEQEFDLVVMTGHAFQVLTGDEQLRASLSRSTLRFLDADSVASFLSDAGLCIEEQYGDWDRAPLSETSPEIITIAPRG